MIMAQGRRKNTADVQNCHIIMSEVCGREESQHVNTLTMGDPDYPGPPKKSRLCPLPEEPETSAGEKWR
jgi:hypothetical protein